MLTRNAKSVEEPDFPFASISRGNKVVVGVNKSFRVADHDFSKVSLTPYLYKIFPSLRMKNQLMNTSMMIVKIYGSMGNSTTG